MEDQTQIKRALNYWWNNFNSRDCTDVETQAFTALVDTNFEEVFAFAVVNFISCDAADKLLYLIRNNGIRECLESLKYENMSKEERELINSLKNGFLEAMNDMMESKRRK